ncbi:ATP-binding response regulator [Hanstruepera ponticola]|uniref:ATP-binding response regulator n=1 Tax=Hanstruepera ponticola TaxID=2042995 RepID=UPI000CF071D3|nr:ATP-binding protein [Hanstruepera ponticola]
MKSNLLISFLFVISLSFSQSDREVINFIDSLNTQAIKHYNNNEIMLAFNSFNDAIKLSDSISDNYGNAVANFNLGNIYAYMHEYVDSKACYERMLASSLKIDDNYLIANSYKSLAKLSEIQHPNEVIPNLEKALEYAQKTDVRDLDNIDKQKSVLFDIRMYLSSIYLNKNNYDSALIYLLRAENNLNDLSYNAYNSAFFNYSYGLYFIQKELYNKANDKFIQAIEHLQGNTHDLNSNLLFSKIYKDLSLSYAQLEDTDMAYYALKEHNSFRDEFINEEKVRQENISKSKFYLAEYKQIAESANNERLIQEQITQKVKNINIIIIITSIVLVISLIMIYRNYRSKRKLSQILEAQNKQLEIAKDQAEKSSQLKTKFISNVTHELRTPLYGVVGLTSLLLKRNDLSERDGKFLKSLKYSGDYLLNLINDILQIGKIESQKMELKPTSVNIRELVDNIIDSFEYKLQETNNKIKVEIDGKVPTFLKCDGVRLSQVLINLVGNSVKFTENDITFVEIKVLNIKPENVCLHFSVKDNGPGIPKEKQDSIFENFLQLDENNNINYKGTGLGLSITKNLVELFGSTIKLESEVGQGSTFSFDVTFEIDNEAMLKANSNKPKTLTLNNNYKILVAEDNKINQIVTKNILEKGNFHCDIAKNGLEAVKAMEIGSYDLILMDINMPLMDGNEATKAIRQTNNQIPIIALTAADIEEVKKDYKAIGYNDIITKPFDNSHFYQTILANIHKSKNELSENPVLVKVS